MTTLAELDRIAINVRSRKLLNQLLEENLRLAEIMHGARNETEALVGVREWVLDALRSRPHALAYYESEHSSRESFNPSMRCSGATTLQFGSWITSSTPTASTSI